MRAIVLARMDKTRPVLVLTRVEMLDVLTRVTVAPITSSVKGLATEVVVGPRNGLDHTSAISCDNIMTVSVGQLGRSVGFLLDDQEPALASAVAAAFALRTR